MNTKTQESNAPHGGIVRATPARLVKHEGGHVTICIKTYGMRFPPGGEDEQRQRAWDAMGRDWHCEAQDISHACGFSGVFTVGRSGGYLQPFNQHGGPFGGSNGKEWPGQGGTYGYPSHPSMLDAGDARKVNAFAASIGALLARAPDMFAAHLAEIISDDKRDAEEMTQRTNRAQSERTLVDWPDDGRVRTNASIDHVLALLGGCTTSDVSASMTNPVAYARTRFHQINRNVAAAIAALRELKDSHA